MQTSEKCLALRQPPPPPAIHPALLRVHSSTFVCIRVCIPACIIHACLRVGKQAGGAEGRNQYGASIRFALHEEARRVGSYVLLNITKYSTCTTSCYQSCEGHLYYLQHHMHHAQLSCPNTARHNPKQPPGHPSKEEKKHSSIKSLPAWSSRHAAVRSTRPRHRSRGGGGSRMPPLSHLYPSRPIQVAN